MFDSRHMLHQEFDADMIVVCLMSMSVYYYKKVSRSFLCLKVASHYITIFVKRSQCLGDTCMEVIISTSSVICSAFFVAYQIHRLNGDYYLRTKSRISLCVMLHSHCASTSKFNITLYLWRRWHSHNVNKALYVYCIINAKCQKDYISGNEVNLNSI